jgi:hypothetical protein
MRAFSVLRPAFLRGVLRFGFQVELERYKLHQLVIGLSAHPKCETIVGRDAAAVWLAVAIPDLLAVPGRAYMKDLLPEIWLFDAESRVLPFIKSEKFKNTTVISNAVDFVS